MKILVISAVDFELEAARGLEGGALDVTLVAAGVGARATEAALERLLPGGGYDLVLDVGIAGSYSGDLPIGSVVHVVTEQHGDRVGGLIVNPAPPSGLGFLPRATGNTLQVLDSRGRDVEADVESMEGAAFFECCLRHGVRFAEIRSVSNYVGERDHSRWDIPLALKNLKNAIETFKNVLK